MKFGYARVSRDDQNLDLQTDALRRAGVDELYEERMSGTKLSRPKLDELLIKLRRGDTLVVWRLDRLGRTARQLITLAERFEAKGISFISLTENFDTSTPAGKFCFTIFCAAAQMERDVLAERTRHGLTAARARGRVGGRKAQDRRSVDTALRMYSSGLHSITEITRATGLSKTTLYKYVRLSKSE